MRMVFGMIADDEARHAELSWDLHDWLAERLSPAARDRVEKARMEAVDRLRLEVASDGTGLSELGVPAGAEAIRLADALAKTLHRAA